MADKAGYVKWQVFTVIILLITGVFTFVAKDYYNHKEDAWCNLVKVKEDVATIKEAVG